MSAVPIEVRAGWERIRAVLSRWWLLLVAAPLIGLAIASGILLATPTRYDSVAIGLVDQPQLTVGEQYGQPTVVKLSDLMPTFATLATSDPVLRRVARDTGVTTSPADLRKHIVVTVPTQTLSLQVTATFPSSDQAGRSAAATLRELGGVLAAYGGDTVPPRERLTLAQVQGPTTTAQPRHWARNLTIAGLLGFGVAIVIAFAFDRG